MINILNRFYPIAFLSFGLLLIALGSYYDISSLENINFINILGILITFIAGITGIICVLLVAKERIENYYFGITSVSLWLIYVLFYSPLMWDVLINVGYLVLNIYGFYYWLNPSKKQQSINKKIAKTRSLYKSEYILYGGIFLIATFILSNIGIKVGQYSSDTQAITDATTTVIAILAQFFMAKKILENWHLWIALNAISIPLYMSIDSITLTATWILYLINSIYGLYMWKLNYNKE